MRAVAEKARARCNWRRLAGILFTVAKVVFADADHRVVVASLPMLCDVTVGEPLVAAWSRVCDVVPGVNGQCQLFQRFLLSAPTATELKLVFAFL